MEFRLFTYEYYLKMIQKIVPKNFKVGIADYEDLYQELFIYILQVENKLINKEVEVYKDLESYIFTQVFYRCRRLINQLTKRKTFEDINYEINYDDISEETIFEEDAELEFKVREYLLSLNLTEKELKSIQDKVGIWFDIDSDIKYNRNMFSKTCTKIRKLREKGYTIQNITEWEIKKIEKRTRRKQRKNMEKREQRHYKNRIYNNR